jgi:glucose 1-dehydrogenase
MTPLQRKAYPTKKLLEARDKDIPMNRHGTPEEIAGVAIFIASDDSSYITGEDIKVDGGSQASMFHLVRQLAEKPSS